MIHDKRAGRQMPARFFKAVSDDPAASFKKIFVLTICPALQPYHWQESRQLPMKTSANRDKVNTSATSIHFSLPSK